MDHLSIEVSLFQAIVQEDTACYICQEVVRGVGILDSMHGVVPSHNIRGFTCGHMVHAQCARGLYNRFGFFREYEVDEGVLLCEWTIKCYCGFYGNIYCSADVSLGKFAFLCHHHPAFRFLLDSSG